MATVNPTKKLMKTPGAKPEAAAAASAPAAEAKPAAAAKKPVAVKKGKAPAAEPETAQAAATETAAATTNAVEAGEDASVDMIVQTAKEVENVKEDKAFTMVPRLMGDIDQNYFRLGGYLSKIQAEGWFLNKGFENFKAYVEAECSIKYRKAMYLINIYNGLVESGIPWSKVADLGWTKLKELAGIMTPENVDDWVEVAKGMTALQLIDYIAKQAAGSDKENSTDSAKDSAKETTTMTFKLHTDQKETVEASLDKAMKQTGTDVKSAALEYIAIDFLGGTQKVVNLTEVMKTKALEDVLACLQEAFPTLVMQASVYDTVEEAQAAQAELDAQQESETAETAAAT